MNAPAKSSSVDWFSNEELRALIMALAKGQESFTEEDISRVVDWAVDARIETILLSGVLDGTFAVNAEGEELTYQTIQK